MRHLEGSIFNAIFSL